MKHVSQEYFIKDFSENDKAKWKDNVCWPACLASITGDSPQDILSELIENNGWDERIGWRHKALMDYLHACSFVAKKIYYRFFKIRIKNILKWNNIIIGSMKYDGWSHLVLIQKYNPQTRSFFIFNPGTSKQDSKTYEIGEKEFYELWRWIGILITI